MASSKEPGNNFVIVRTLSPREVVELLLREFPAMQDVICPDEFCFEEPTRSYDCFAAEVIRRKHDQQFMTSVAQFSNVAAKGRDYLLRTALETSLLEGIAADEEVARKLAGMLGETALKLLHDIERKVYGRNRPGNG